eukprot:m.1205262 g.1205262  ORF g.1205262 m.1205262 type:complete len:165 (+) comp24582_c0_seq20:3406-3900(+)
MLECMCRVTVCNAYVGVNRRCVRELLRVTQERDNVDYTIKVSLLEIYNEKIVDLLSELPVDVQECDLRMDPKTKLGYVTNLTERVVSSIADVVQTLADGEKNRHVASTKMNSTSSRSHLLLQLLIEGHDTISGQMSKGKCCKLCARRTGRVYRRDCIVYRGNSK